MSNRERHRHRHPPIVSPREDHLLDPKNGPYIMDHVGSKDKRLLWLEDSYHVATLDYDLDLIIDEAIEFAGLQSGQETPKLRAHG